MKRLLPLLAGTALLLLVSCAVRAQDDQQSAEGDEKKIDAQVTKVVQQMADYLTARKSTSVDLSMKVQGEGVPLPQNSDNSMKIRYGQPNRFAFQMDQGGQAMTVVSNGEKLYTYLQQTDRYTVEEAPESLAAAENPLLQGILSGPYLAAVPVEGMAERLLADVNSAEYVGKEKLGDVSTHRLHFEEADSKWDLWVAEGDQPLAQQIIVDLTDAIAPQAKAAGLDPDKIKMSMVIAFNNWKVDYAPKADAYSFDPPEEAKKVDSLADLFAPVSPAEKLVGKAAPAFELELLDGGDVKLANLKDKKIVILDFWATWCAPCVRALPTISKVAEQFKDQGVELYAVNLQEEAEQVKKFLKDKELDVTVAMDREGEVAQAYYASAIPQTVIVGRDGRVQVVHVGLLPNLEEQLTEELQALVDGKDLTEGEAEGDKAAKPAKK